MRHVLTLAVAAVLSFGWAGSAVAQAKPDGGDTRIRLQEYPGSILGLPMWVAIEKGICKNYNLRCSTVGLASGPLGLQTLAAGSIEATFASNEVNLMAYSRGNDIQLVVGHTPNNYYTLNVRNGYDLPNRDKGYPEVMQDLKGAKIGVTARGSGIEIVMRALLQSAGMDPDSVTYVAVGAPATSYPAMLAGQIDGSVSFEPFNTLCLMLDTCVELVAPGKNEGPADMLAMNGGFASYTMRRNFVESNPEVVEAFIASIKDAMAWMQAPENFDELVDITRKHISLGDIKDGDKVLVELVRGQTTSVGPKIERGAIDATSKFLMTNKLSDKSVSATDIVYKNAPDS